MTAAESPERTAVLADAAIELGALALAFGRIDRTGCYHRDQLTPESDTDHTVMLARAARSLAALLHPGELDTGLVAQFAVAHDAVEVFAGDTPTLRSDAAGKAAKAQREQAAAQRRPDLFAGRLPSLPQMISRYERQEKAAARFVRAVDKGMPEIVHFQDAAAGLAREGIPVGRAGRPLPAPGQRHQPVRRAFHRTGTATPRAGRPGHSHGHRHNDGVRARPWEPLQPDGGRISLEEAQAG